MEKEIIEGNTLIAEFMGMVSSTKFHTDGAICMYAPPEEGAMHAIPYIVDKSLDKFDEFRELKYHSSWDWLHPVMVKINELEFIKKFPASLHSDILYHQGSVTRMRIVVDIEHAWSYVVEFVKSYNKLKS